MGNHTFVPYEVRDYNKADWKYEKLMEQIDEFQRELSDDVDVCMKFTSFGQSVMMYVDSIGYQNPDLLYFYGTIDRNEAQLIQHMSQLSFLLLSQPKQEPDAEPIRIPIGFHPSENTGNGFI